MKQVEADIAIVGAGTAGLAAAVAAAERGARVIAFEKASVTGGTGNMSMGLFAVESKPQRRSRIALTREQAFRIFMDYTHWRPDARLVRTIIDKSASTIDWLEDMGIEFNDPETHFSGSYTVWHTVRSGTVSGHAGSSIMLKTMTDRALDLGVKIFFQTPAKKILKAGGRIVGMMAEDKSGEDIQANAKAVIIATGGFGDNPEWIKKYTGYDWARDLFGAKVPGLVGDGIRMAWEVGAGPTEMTMHLIYDMPRVTVRSSPRSDRIDTEASLTGRLAFRQPNLLVNLLGERFVNEEIMANHAFMGNAIAGQKNRCAFMIFDEAATRHYEENGLDIVWGARPIVEVDNLAASINQAINEGDENIFAADSLEELAVKTGINLDGLKKTVNEYNKVCETGRDELFNKNPRYLRPIREPKFYAGKLMPWAYGSLGGIKINYKTEVLTKDYNVIPGLYGAGYDANALYGDTYVYILPGSTMAFAVNSGRIAGENAAEYAKSIAK